MNSSIADIPATVTSGKTWTIASTPGGPLVSLPQRWPYLAFHSDSFLALVVAVAIAMSPKRASLKAIP